MWRFGARMHGLKLGHMDWGRNTWIEAGTCRLGPGRVELRPGCMDLVPGRLDWGWNVCTGAMTHVPGPGHVYWGWDMCTGAVMHGPGLGRMYWGHNAWIGAGTHHRHDICHDMRAGAQGRPGRSVGHSARGRAYIVLGSAYVLGPICIDLNCVVGMAASGVLCEGASSFSGRDPG